MWIDRLKEWLRVEDRSQAWLARKAHVNPDHLSQCLRGHRAVGESTLLKLETAMGIEEGSLVALKDSQREPSDAGAKK